MNNLYHRVAVTSVGIALGFTLGANKEARAVTFTFTPTRSLYLLDTNLDGVEETGNDYPGERYAGLRRSEDYTKVEGEYRSFYQFNIAKLLLDPNTRIESAILQTRINSVQYAGLYSRLQAYGYTEDFPSFGGGEYLDQKSLVFILEREPARIATFNVLPFINQRIENNDSFWLSIRRYGESGYDDEEAFVTLSREASLTITTAVPEPTTIFGSAIGLCLGGWLKRRKSAPQNKTTSQN
jgi:PEP-CTERM putative exosortase interaction domain